MLLELRDPRRLIRAPGRVAALLVGLAIGWYAGVRCAIETEEDRAYGDAARGRLW